MKRGDLGEALVLILFGLGAAFGVSLVVSGYLPGLIIVGAAGWFGGLVVLDIRDRRP